MTINDSGNIIFDLYTKETAKVQYLLPSSCHPSHITRNIPYSLAYRIRRIVTEQETFERRLETLRQHLLSRSYPPKVIDLAFEKVKKIPRSIALERVEKKKTNRTPFVVTYHPAQPSVTSIVRQHWKVMTDQSEYLKRCFPQPSVVAYKRSKNIGDILIRAKFNPNRHSKRVNTGYILCGRLFGCKACQLSGLQPGQRIPSHKCQRTGKEWQITSSLNCHSSNVIYKLSCKKCAFVYIGETSRKFSERLAEHRGYIKKKDLQKPAGKHFNQKGHSIADLVGIAIEKVMPVGDNQLRKCRESLWINNYGSVSYGANSRN